MAALVVIKAPADIQACLSGTHAQYSLRSLTYYRLLARLRATSRVHRLFVLGLRKNMC